MDTKDREAIAELFEKLGQAERHGGMAHRDPDAEALIRERMTAQPGAAYYMAQTVVAQEQALVAAQERIEFLEQELASRPNGGPGGFLASLFGGGGAAQPIARGQGFNGHGHGSGVGGSAPGWMGSGGMGAGGAGTDGRGPAIRGGSGFLGGAVQTAMGVAGGAVLGGLLASAFSGSGSGDDQAASAQPASTEADGSSSGFDAMDSEAA